MTFAFHSQRIIPPSVAVLWLAACTTSPTAPGSGWVPPAASNPSAVIATELAFARAARSDGQWTAFRDYATKDAVWPAPAFEDVQQSLKDLGDPEQAIAWEPDAVWMSCDGTYALSTGPATHPSGRKSRFTTIWQRQADGDYRWVLDQGFDLEAGYTAPEMISARVADCPARGRQVEEGRDLRHGPARRGLDWASGSSADGTFAWNTVLRADCSRTLTIRMLKDGEMREVFSRSAAAPTASAGQPAPTCPG